MTSTAAATASVAASDPPGTDDAQPDYDWIDAIPADGCAPQVPLVAALCPQDNPCPRHQAEVDQIETARRVVEQAAEDAAFAKLGTMLLSEVPTDPSPPPLLSRIEQEGHTILFGDGGAGKGLLTCDWIGRLVRHEHLRVLIVDYEHNQREWSRRMFGMGYDECREAVMWLSPYAAGYQHPPQPLWEIRDQLRLAIKRHRADLVVVDSINHALVNGDPVDASVAGRYSGVAASLGIPVLSLAHVNRSQDHSKPFGSAGWHNGARMTWSLEKESTHAVLTNRKANNHAPFPKVMVEVLWRDNLPVNLSETTYHETLGEKINRLLEHPKTEGEIVKALNDEAAQSDYDGHKEIDQKSVNRALNRGLRGNSKRPTPLFTKAGAAWQRWQPEQRLAQPAVPATAQESLDLEGN